MWTADTTLDVEEDLRRFELGVRNCWRDCELNVDMPRVQRRLALFRLPSASVRVNTSRVAFCQMSSTTQPDSTPKIYKIRQLYQLCNASVDRRGILHCISSTQATHFRRSEH
jgi:hypothetical protein